MCNNRISDGFWNACLYMEDECHKLIETELKYGVTDQLKELEKRLNYYFYDIVYRWAKKESFYSIKQSYPIVEEGIVIKCIQSTSNVCKVVKEMSIKIGDVQLAKRMDDAEELLKREIMSTQSLYFE